MLNLSMSTAKLLIEMNAAKYHFVNQGTITVDTIDDKEELQVCDVCMKWFTVTKPT